MNLTKTKYDKRPGYRALALVGLWIALAVVWHQSNAENDDLVVSVESDQSLSQIVIEHLKSERFLVAIASYNNIEDSYAALPAGSQVRIPQPYLPLADFGEIVYLKGNVSHQQGNRLVNPPVAGSQVFAGDIFSTGADGFVSIQFRGGARASVQPSSRMVVGLIDCLDINACKIGLKAAEGEILSDIAKPADDALPITYTIETPFLSATVRGTRFYASSDAKESRLGVTRGAVGAAASDAEFDLNQGQGLLAGEGVVPAAVELLDPPIHTIDQDDRLISPEDNFYWQQMADAQGYQVIVASDEALSQQYSVTETLLPRWFPKASPGDYYVAISGLDDNGFAGLPARRKIRYASVDDETAPSLAVEKQGDTLRITPLVDIAEPVQILLANSLSVDAPFEHRTVQSLGDGIELELDADLDWLIRARRLLGPYSVSAYTDSYFFSSN
jgi:hypothetical protein